MTEEEARMFLFAQGWIYQMRPLAGVWNVYAYHIRQGRQVHLCPLASLDQQTEESLLATLNDDKH